MQCNCLKYNYLIFRTPLICIGRPFKSEKHIPCGIMIVKKKQSCEEQREK